MSICGKHTPDVVLQGIYAVDKEHLSLTEQQLNNLVGFGTEYINKGDQDRSLYRRIPDLVRINLAWPFKISGAGGIIFLEIIMYLHL